MTDRPFVGYPGSVALDRGDAAAVVMASDGAQLTYADLDLRSTRLARILREHGMQPGGHLALLMGNESRFLEVCWAALRSGLYCTPISPRATVAEAAYIVGDAGATDLIVGSALHQLGLEVRESVSTVRGLIAVDGGRVGLADYEEIVASGPTTTLDSETEGAMLLYSSGTTGRPKGVERPLSGRPPGSSNPMAPFMPRLGLSPASVFLCPGPLYHAAPVGFSLAVQRVGGTVVLMERFDARGVLAAIERFKVTHTQLVPTMMLRILRLPAEVRAGYDVSSLQRIVHAAAPCPSHVKREFIEWLGPIVDEYYSGTEGSGIT
jgi:acyl-CoA synthetase (AMP-forming)/AMP-acid ligase II